MLQRIIAAVLLVAGLVGVGLGVASATVWRDSDTVVATTSYAGDGTMLVTEPGVLDLVDDDVTIRATTPDDQVVTLVVGRDVDVAGWVGDDPHGVVDGLADWDALSTAPFVPEPEQDPSADESPGTDESPSEDATDDSAADATDDSAADAADETTEDPADDASSESSEDGTEAPAAGVDPAGSDMWLAEATGEGSATLRWSDQPGRWRVLAAGVGEGATAPTLELSWPREVSTPWLWPGVIGGAVLILLGLFVGMTGLRSGRRKTSGRRGTTAATPVVAGPGDQGSDGPGAASSGTDEPGSATSTPVPGRSSSGDVPPTVTRRELRERDEAERLAAQQARGQRPRRAWLTGQIPIVSKDRRPRTAAQPVVEPVVPEPQDNGTTRADAWRRTWGFAPTPGPAPTDEPTTSGPDETTDDTKDGTP
ncbi:hypothetical protein [Cellulosimicrobium arenosum]|uniref:hypothetical protein n=1 Tax=Cellulosimicrobium arenosum TaxID=2708133 RepID=UPI00177BB3F7|nr:hypothetical protein [Cellulosimicrobium arenosum]